MATSNCATSALPSASSCRDPCPVAPRPQLQQLTNPRITHGYSQPSWSPPGRPPGPSPHPLTHATRRLDSPGTYTCANVLMEKLWTVLHRHDWRCACGHWAGTMKVRLSSKGSNMHVIGYLRYLFFFQRHLHLIRVGAYNWGFVLYAFVWFFSPAHCHASEPTTARVPHVASSTCQTSPQPMNAVMHRMAKPRRNSEEKPIPQTPAGSI